MAHQWEIVEAANCVVVTWGKSFDIGEYLGFYADFMAHSDFHPGINRLYDLRATRMAMSVSELKELTDQLQQSEHRQGRRQVVLLVSDDLSFGVMRQFVVTAAPLDVDYHVTRSVDEARSLLALPADYALPTKR